MVSVAFCTGSVLNIRWQDHIKSLVRFHGEVNTRGSTELVRKRNYVNNATISLNMSTLKTRRSREVRRYKDTKIRISMGDVEVDVDIKTGTRGEQGALHLGSNY